MTEGRTPEQMFALTLIVMAYAFEDSVRAVSGTTIPWWGSIAVVLFRNRPNR